jgi:hypothetical protein
MVGTVLDRPRLLAGAIVVELDADIVTELVDLASRVPRKLDSNDIVELRSGVCGSAIR